MKTFRIVILVPIAFCLSVAYAVAGSANDMQTGEELFMKHCSACHPDGGNVLEPHKTLRKKDRMTNNIKSAKDIVGKMRNPGPGMTKFDKNVISDKGAEEIAAYILKTF
ncbi:MAG: c-type cytochrome [Thermodesulfovibrionales bacterium]